MRRTLLALLAGTGVLAAGCTTNASQAMSSRPPTSAAECDAISDTSSACTGFGTVSTDEPLPTHATDALKRTVGYMTVGHTAWLVTDPSPFEMDGTVCNLRGDADTDVVGEIDGRRSNHRLLIEHPAESVWVVTEVKNSRRWTFTEGPNMRGLLTSDGKCPASPQ